MRRPEDPPTTVEVAFTKAKGALDTVGAMETATSALRVGTTPGTGP